MQSGQEVVSLHLDDIIPNRFQPREVFDERALKELAASIREHGVIQPIIVRQVNNKYEIIAGERRYKASALAGMTKIPAIVNNLDDKEAAKVALLENLQRRNLNAIEEARTYQKILELDQMTQESLAKTMGKSQSSVANKLRLLALPEEVQNALLKDEISERHARTLLNLKSPEEQKRFLDRIISEKLSVRKLEEEIKKANGEENTTEEKEELIKDGGEKMNNTLENSAAIPGGIPDNFVFEKKQSHPEEEQQEAPTQFNPNDIINYGNIDEDEINYGEKADHSIFNSTQTTAAEKPNVSQLKTEAVDINNIFNNEDKSDAPALGKFDINKLMQTNIPLQEQKSEQTMPQQQEKAPAPVKVDDQKSKISNDLDSLLNIKPRNPKTFNATKNMIDSNAENQNDDKKEYFNENDLSKIELPNISSTTDAFIKSYDEPMQVKEESNQNDLSGLNKDLSFFQPKAKKKEEPKEERKSLGMALLEETYNIPKKEKAKNYSFYQMIQKIRDTLSELERAGAKIDTDEIDFENQYQIVIKIDKNN